jgi:hypothetical protein
MEIPQRVSGAFDEAQAALDDRRDLDAKLFLAAAITVLAREEGLTPVVTGGTSVDFYAAEAVESGARLPLRWKASQDVDIVTLGTGSYGRAKRLRRALYEAGFEPSSDDTSQEAIERERGFKHPEIPIPVEVIAEAFEGDPDKTVELAVDGFTVILRGPEDTLFEHVEWVVHTDDQRSWTRALAIAKAQADELDEDYLQARAEELGDEYVDALDRCLAGEALE